MKIWQANSLSFKSGFLDKCDNLKGIFRLAVFIFWKSRTHLTCLLAALPIAVQLIALSTAAGDCSGAVPVTAVMQAATILMLTVEHLYMKNNDKLLTLLESHVHQFIC